MKLRKVFKISLLSQSLLLVSLPIHAQAPLVQKKSSQQSVFGTEIPSGSSLIDLNILNSSNVQPSAVDYERIKRNIEKMDPENYSGNDYNIKSYKIEGLPELMLTQDYTIDLEAKKEKTSQDYNTSFCGGRFEEVQLPGISGLVKKIERMCSAKEVPKFFEKVKDRGLLGFCGYISQKFGNGGCYDNLNSGDGLDKLEGRVVNDPVLRQKFIEKEKEQLKKERDKMLQVSSFQMLMAQDANTLLLLKAALHQGLTGQGQGFANMLAKNFGFNELDLESIKNGTIELESISDHIFQCKPDQSSYTVLGSIDRNLMNQCGADANDEKNKIVQEAYDQLKHSKYEGLLSNQKSPLRDYISQGLGDNYKEIIDLYTPSDRRKNSNTNSEQYSLNYVRDANKVLSLMDTQRTNSTSPLKLSKVIDDTLKNQQLSEAQKFKQVQAQALMITIDTLENSFKGDDTNKKIMEIIKKDYVVKKDGYQSLDFKGGGIEGALADIRGQLGQEDVKGGVVNKSLRMVLAGASLGTNMLKSAKWHKRIVDKFESANSSKLSKLSKEKPFSRVLDHPSKNDRLLSQVKAYFETDRNSGDLTFKDFVASLNRTNDNSKKTSEANVSTFNFGLVVAMAQECRNLTKPKEKGDMVSHLCPTVNNPVVSELLIEDTMRDPNAFSSDKQEQSIKDIYAACVPVSVQAIYFNTDGGEDEKVSAVCKYMNHSKIMSSSKSSVKYAKFKQRCETIEDIKTTSATLDVSNVQALVDKPISVLPGQNSTTHFSDYYQQNKGPVIDYKTMSSDINFSKLSSFGFPISPKITKFAPQTALANTRLSQNKIGVNAKTFGTKKAALPSGNFFPMVNTPSPSQGSRNASSSSEMNSSKLKDQLLAKNGVIDPNIQKILDRMSAMEAREKSLVEKLAQANKSSDKDNTHKKDKPNVDSETAKKLAAVTKELAELKKRIPALVAKASATAKQNQMATVNRNVQGITPSQGPSNAGRVARASGGSIAPYSGSPAASMSSGLASDGEQIRLGQNPSRGAFVGQNSINGGSAPAYTNNNTFVLTQSIRDKAQLIPAGASIEEAVLRSKRPILIPYGNGKYMYVEPKINASGEVVTRDGQVVYEEVLKVSDAQAIASKKASKDNWRAPANIDRADPNGNVHRWADLSRLFDEAQK